MTKQDEETQQNLKVAVQTRDQRELALPNRMSLRRGPQCLTLNLPLIIQFLSRHNISFSVLHTPLDIFEYSLRFRVVPVLKLKLKLIYDRHSVGQSVPVSGAHLGPLTNFSFALKFSIDSCVFVVLYRPL
jgi:hypothetical protein